MTKFSFEVPIPHLHDFDDLQDFVFALTCLCKREAYGNYLHNTLDKGLKTIWVDNSFNENLKPDHWSNVVRWGRFWEATKTIAPDSPDMSLVDIHRNWIAVSKRLSPGKTICVVKDWTMRDFMIKAGCTHFAIGFRTRPQWSPYEIAKTPNVHFLGLNDLQELKMGPPSCDTSLPIKLALKGRTLREWHEHGQGHITKGMPWQEYFSLEMTTQQIDLARRNICQLKEIANNPTIQVTT